MRESKLIKKREKLYIKSSPMGYQLFGLKMDIVNGANLMEGVWDFKD
jgi:hypothetical protein